MGAAYDTAVLFRPPSWPAARLWCPLDRLRGVAPQDLQVRTLARERSDGARGSLVPERAFEVEVEEVLPRVAGDGAGLELREVEAVLGENAEAVGERAPAVWERE